jgi:hypothetical protein
MKELSYFSPFTSPPLLDKSLASPVVLIRLTLGYLIYFYKFKNELFINAINCNASSKEKVKRIAE